MVLLRRPRSIRTPTLLYRNPIYLYSMLIQHAVKRCRENADGLRTARGGDSKLGCFHGADWRDPDFSSRLLPRRLPRSRTNCAGALQHVAGIGISDGIACRLLKSGVWVDWPAFCTRQAANWATLVLSLTVTLTFAVGTWRPPVSASDRRLLMYTGLRVRHRVVLPAVWLAGI
jgi:hypothetical protein